MIDMNAYVYYKTVVVVIIFRQTEIVLNHFVRLSLLVVFTTHRYQSQTYNDILFYNICVWQNGILTI